MSAQILFLTAMLAASAPLGQPTSARPEPSSNPSGDRPAPAAIPPAVTVDGCVATESEIPGRKVSLGERVRLNRHFLLFHSKVVKGKAPASPPASGGAAAYGRLYKISGLTDEQLKIHVGRRVRIEGSFGDLEEASAADPDPSELVELNVTTIRQVPGDCSVAKS
jgi:hypothetical protein